MHHPAIRSARQLVLVLCLGWLGQCSRPPTLLVTVNGVPPGAASLAVFIAKQGDADAFVAPQEDLHPYELPMPASAQVSFVLRMPDALAAQLTVSAAAFSKAGATGCVLRTSSAAHAFQPSLLDDSVTIDLGTDAVDTTCQGSLRILSTSPTRLHASGGETLTVNGWGFRPGSRLMLDGVALPTTYRSAAVLEAVVPPAVHVGRVPLALEVPGQAAVAFSGLRYVVDNVAFTPLGPVPTPTQLRGIQVADLDGDGRPDLVSLPIAFAGTDLVVMLQKQPLTFTAQTITVAAKMVDLVVSDVDKDGDVDLVTASATDKNLKLLRNNGSGTFVLETQLLPFTPSALAAADLNGDGAPELLLLDDKRLNMYTLPNDGSGHFGTPTVTTLQKVMTPLQITPLDYDLDGKTDILLDSLDINTLSYNMAILLNQGAGVAASDANAQLLNFPDYIDVPVLTGDLDGDGKGDVLVSVSAEDYHIFPSTGQPARKEQKFAPSCLSSIASSADLTGDGLGDLLVACVGGSRLEFMLQSTASGFATSSQAPAVVVTGGSFFINILAADLSGDGLPELLVQTDTNYTIYKNTSR